MKWIIPTLLILTSIALGGNVPELQTKNQGSVLHIQYFDAGKKILMTYYTGVEVYDAQNLKQLHSISLDGYYYDRKKIAISEDFNQLFIAGHNTFKVYNLQDGSLIYQKKFSDSFSVESMQFSEFEKQLQVVCERSNGLSQQGYKLFAWFKDTYDLVGKKYIMSKQTIDPQERKYDHGGCTSIDKQWSLANESRGYGIKKNGITVSHFNFNFYDKNEPRCAFSPDNRQIIVAGSQFVVYDINESRSRIPSILAQEPIQKIGIARDKMLLQGDNLYIGWDLKAGKELWRNFSYKTGCHDCSPDPDHVLLKYQDRAFILPSYGRSFDTYIGGKGGLIDIDMNTGLTKPLPIAYMGSLRLSDDDKRLVVGSGDGKIRVYDIDQAKMIATFQGGEGEAYVGGFERPEMFISYDGKKIFQQGARYGTNEPISYFDIDTNQTTNISTANISQNLDDYSIARRHYCNGKLTLTEFNYRESNESKKYDNPNCIIKQDRYYLGKLASVSHDGQKIILKNPTNNQLNIYDLKLQKMTRLADSTKIKSLILSSDDHYLYAFNDLGELQKILLSTGQIIKKVHLENIVSIQEIENGRLLLSKNNGQRQLIDQKTFKPIVTFSFVSFEEGEWIFLTEQGYFNASSKRVLKNIIINDTKTKRALSDDEIKKYYRPDIVGAILQNKPIKSLLKTATNFVLGDKGNYKNQYKESLRQMYFRDGNIHVLSSLANKNNLEYLPHIMKAISETNDASAMDGLYRGLGQYDKSLTRDFVFDRITQKRSEGEIRAVLSMTHIDRSWLREIASMYQRNIPIYLDESYLVRLLDKKGYIDYVNIIWNVIEQEGWILNKDVMSFVEQNDTQRLEQIWKKYLSAYFEGRVTRNNSIYIDDVANKMYEMDRAWITPLLLAETKKYDKEFNVRPYRKLNDPIFFDPILNRIDDNNTFNDDVYALLRNFKNSEMNAKIAQKLHKSNCLKFKYDWKKSNIERDLNITLPCVN